RKRTNRRSRGQALRRLLPERRARPHGQGRAKIECDIDNHHWIDNPHRILWRTGMSNLTWMNPFRLTLGVSLFACAAVATAQPTFGNPSPTAGKETSQKANAAA